MPDTPENQAKYPHRKSHQPSIGLPIARALALVSLATACVLDLKVGPYQGQELDVTPEIAGRLSEVVVRAVRYAQPDATIFLVAVTPTPSRFEYWPRIQQVNLQFQQQAKKYPKVHFLATESLFLDSRGQPREELFVEDRLHLNEEGYAIWSKLFLDALREHSLKP